MTSRAGVFFLAACFLCAGGTASAAPGGKAGDKAGDKVGRNQMCIMSNYIEDTPVIDSHTILVRMNPGRGYKRIDLASDCASLNVDMRVTFATSLNRLCVQDRLKAAGPDGQSCVIAKIVTIDENEARYLMSHKAASPGG